MKKRRYALYVSGVQELADDHVANIAAMLESPRYGIFYPQAAARKLGKYGHSKGWRRNRLRTASGFTIDAIGLDTAARGIKMEEDRPDILILDDIDEEGDTKDQVEKKIKMLTRKLIPAGSKDLAIIAVQNLIHQNSIFARFAGKTDEKAEFMLDRIVSGPIPAVEDLEYEQVDGEWIITDGSPTWEGMDLDTCEEFMMDWGLTAFLNEAQHAVTPPPGGMFDHLNFDRLHVDYQKIAPLLVRKVVWVDPAVSDTDRSDSHGVQCDGLGSDGKVYKIYSWEHRSSPEKALEKAIKTAVRFGAESVGVETDQGGDTWHSVYANALATVEEELGKKLRIPFKSAKAGSIGSKTHRASQMLFDYERDNIRHCLGTHDVLEAALHRFPRTKPFDLVDVNFWTWLDLRELDVGDGIVEDEDEDNRVSISPL